MAATASSSQTRRWSRQRLETLGWQLWAGAVIAAMATAFYLPALATTGGSWPVPLDDVYIYFGHARSWALGAPFAWYPGNGYSSGATAVLYPLLLAPFWALGLRGSALGIGAAIVAVVSLFDLCRSLRRVAGKGPIAWAWPPLVVSLPLLDWSLFSGMETALFGALLGRALASSSAALRAPAERRAGRQLVAGAWMALLVLARPEALIATLGLAVAITHGARSLGTWPTLARSLGPSVAALGAQAAANRWLTGEWAQAGAVRKLITSSPYRAGPSLAIDALTNAAVLAHQGILRALGGWPLALGALLLTLAALTLRHRRRLAVALLTGAVGSLALVCLNTTARYQNYRYAAPSLLMLLCAAALGAAALGRRRRLRPVAWALLLLAVVAPSRELGLQLRHFARASANIEEQHGEVARRLAAMRPPPRRVLVGDAGAIPYLSGLPPLDGLGLGGLYGLPFARASVHGLPAVVELIERLDAGDRPDVMALYPSWWGGVADVFGRRLDSVTIADNVICAADEKVIYAADWSSLAPRGERRHEAVDTLDVGDLVSERSHGFTFEGGAGWVVGVALRQRRGRLRYDAGRIHDAGQAVSFQIDASVAPGPARVVMRTDTEAAQVELRVALRRGGVTRSEGTLTAAGDDAEQGDWRELELALAEVRGGDRLQLRSQRGSWRCFHIWLLRR